MDQVKKKLAALKEGLFRSKKKTNEDLGESVNQLDSHLVLLVSTLIRYSSPKKTMHSLAITYVRRNHSHYQHKQQRSSLVVFAGHLLKPTK